MREIKLISNVIFVAMEKCLASSSGPSGSMRIITEEGGRYAGSGNVTIYTGSSNASNSGHVSIDTGEYFNGCGGNIEMMPDVLQFVAGVRVFEPTRKAKNKLAVSR